MYIYVYIYIYIGTWSLRVKGRAARRGAECELGTAHAPRAPALGSVGPARSELEGLGFRV